MKKICKLCGKEFRTDYGNNEYCSFACVRGAIKENEEKIVEIEKGNDSIHNKVCVYCGEKFYANHHSKKYCSNKCKKNRVNEENRYLRQKVDSVIYGIDNEGLEKAKKFKKVCIVCGEEFDTNIDNQRYCSHKCKAKKAYEKKKIFKKEVAEDAGVISMDIEITEIKVVGEQTFIGKRIPVIEGGFGEGKRCLTDKAIAEIHNQPVGEIRRLINDNLKRFKESVDLIDLKHMGDTHLFINLDFTKAQVGNSKHIYLLSERGYAKLIKIMDTDLAWEIHDELIDRYFSMREQLREIKAPKLTRKQELAILIIEGGEPALKASKELASIEAKEAEDKASKEAEKEKEILELKHKERLRLERASRNQAISVTTVVDMLGIKDLNTVLFNRWLSEEKNLGTYETPKGEKKRRFEPNKDFFRWVALEGYSFTGKTIRGDKTHVMYSTNMVEKVQRDHMRSLVNFVKVNA